MGNNHASLKIGTTHFLDIVIGRNTVITRCKLYQQNYNYKYNESIQQGIQML